VFRESISRPRARKKRFKLYRFIERDLPRIEWAAFRIAAAIVLLLWLIRMVLKELR
jgi:hypothetical protein